MTGLNQADTQKTKLGIVLVSLAIFMVAGMIAWYVHHSQKQLLTQILSGHAEQTKTRLIQSTQYLLADLNAMSRRWAAAIDKDNEKYWRAYSEDFLSRAVGVKVFLWMQADYEIKWSEPKIDMRSSMAKILQDTDVVLKLVKARENQEAEISQPYQVNDEKVVYIFQPVGSDENFNGFIVIQVVLDDFISNELGKPENTGFYTSGFAEGELLFSNGLNTDDYPNPVSFELDMDGDSDGWVFKVQPTLNTLSLIISPLPYFIVGVGAIIAFLFMLMLRSRENARNESFKLAKEISEKEKIQFELEYLANHDTLTHLPNRHYITNLIHSKAQLSKNNDQFFTILFIDLDHFKDINDTLGHAVGDEMLKKLPILFNKVFRHDDVIARMGGDEFIVYLPGKMEVSHVEKLVERFLKSLEYPIKIGEHLIRLTGSVGVAFYPQHGSDVNELLSHADAALYRAKAKGRNTFAIYDSEIEQKTKDRINLIAKLHDAHENDEFEMYFQPRYELNTEKLIGAEALIRWNSPDNGMIEPAVFIDLLEETSLIIPISWRMLRRCCEKFVKLFEVNKDIFMSFNISAKQLEHPEFLSTLKDTLLEYDFPPSQLELELTEQTLIQNVQNSRFILDKLKELGVSIAIDDFGTGYSSLSYLKNFQVNILKIDKSFIQDIDTDTDDLELVKTMIAMGKNLKITTVAEGVENETQLNLLKAEACDQVQGYYYHPALKFYDFYQLVKHG